MSTDNNKMTDEFDVALGSSGDDDQPAMTTQVTAEGRVERVENGTLEPIGDTPTSERKSDWVDYCVKLGADRHYLTTETEHGIEGSDDVEVHKPLTLKELQTLASDLGG